MLEWLDSSSKSDRPNETDDDSRKRRKLPFAAAESLEEQSFTDTRMTEYNEPCSVDLCAKSICAALRDVNRQKPIDAHGWYLGYIDSRSEEAFRHYFYEDVRQTRNLERMQASVPNQQAAVLMSEMMSHPAETSLSIVDQLKLARNLAFAVLKFHSTPWLGDYFTFRNLSFFKTGNSVPKWLETLHVTLDFVQTPTISLTETACTGHGEKPRSSGSLETFKVIEVAKLQYGVRNMTLWSLGTGLLQIGKWSLENLDDVPSIRRAAADDSNFGPKYRDLTKKCLECDFGCGDDLSKPRLQQAVYESLVCGLTDMIQALEVCE